MKHKVLSMLIALSLAATSAACASGPATDSATSQSIASTSSTSESSVPQDDSTASSVFDAAASDTSKNQYYEYEGIWAAADNPEQTIRISPSGYDNTFDVFVDMPAGDGTAELYSMQAMYAPEEGRLVYSNGTIANKEASGSDTYVSTGNSGFLRFDDEDGQLYWTDHASENTENVIAFAKTDDASAAEETTEISGTAEEVLNNVVFVSDENNNTHMCLFTPNTTFDFGKEEMLGVDDDVRVSCSVLGTQVKVNSLQVVDHKEKINYFKGLVVDVDDQHATVTNNSLSVTFSRDGDTELTGEKLERGAEVTVGYVGDISESPYAVTIEGTQKSKSSEAKTAYSIRGIVSDVADNAVLLSINSAHAYLFSRDKDTTVSGVSKAYDIGDDVIITYTGGLDTSPVATDINIVRKADNEKYMLTGIIDSSDDKALQIKTDNAKYTFAIDKNTAYTGDKAAPGNKAVVVYVNKLDNNPLAISVYCTEQEAPKKAQKEEAKKAKKNSKKKAKKKKAKEKAVEQQQEAVVTQAPAQSAEVTPAEPTPAVTVTPAPAVEPEITEAPEPTVIPEPKPEPEITDAPVPEPEPVITDAPEPEPEPEITDAPEPEPEPEITDAPEPEPEPEITDAPEPEEQPAEEIKIEKEGTITEWNEGSYCTIKCNDGETLQLSLTSDSSIASGYFPEAGDVVRVVFDKANNSVVKLQLLERPAAEDAGEESAE